MAVLKALGLSFCGSSMRLPGHTSGSLSLGTLTSKVAPSLWGQGCWGLPLCCFSPDQFLCQE